MPARFPLALAAVLALAALAWRLGGYPLLEPDEGRNAEVMREVTTGGPWWLPRLNGLPYADKPVAYYAVGALALAAFGPSEAAARLPSLLFTIGTLAIVAWFARRTLDPAAAWRATAIAAASPFTLAYARVVIPDAALACWTVGAIVGFHQAIERARAEGQAGWWPVAAWAAVGLGVLTKGPVALAVPLLVAVPYAVWRRRVSAVLDPTGMLAALALVLPWLFAVSHELPDFLHYVLFVETADRVASDVLGRTEPWWYFLPILVGASLPWSLTLIPAARDAVRRLRRRQGTDPLVVLLLLWIVAPLILFSLSRSKRPQYVLPLVPAVALLVATVWQRVEGRVLGTRVAGAAMVVMGVGLVVLAGALPGWFPASTAVAAIIPGTARWLGAVAIVGGGAAVALARYSDWPLPALVLPVSAIPVVALPLMGAIGADRSSRAVARAIEPVLGSATEVVAVGVFPLSLPFYLDRTLTLATDDARELTSNYVVRHQAELRRRPGSTLRPAGWWREALALCDRPRVFVVPAERRDLRALLESAVPLRAENRRVAAYGPCGAGALARGP